MITLANFRKQYLSIQSEIDEAVARVLNSGCFILGPEVEAFEQEFAAYCSARRCIAVNSGTSALHLALLAAGIGPGDEVITAPFTFVASIAAIEYAGATPVLVDIEPRTFNIDPSRVEQAITARTRAILPVHLYGQPADMDPLLDMSRRRNLLVIEDAAQAHGARYRDRAVGAIGELACFSFYPSKNLGGFGEGGAVTTDNEEYANRVRMLRDWGQDRKYHFVVRGYNYRMDGLQAALLRVKLRHLEQWTAVRRSHAAAYRRMLAGVPRISLPYESPEVRHVYHQFTVRAERRDDLKRGLLEREIQTGIHYPAAVHEQPAYSSIRRCGELTHSERAARQVLSLPVHSELSEQEVSRVAEAVAALAG